MAARVGPVWGPLLQDRIRSRLVADPLETVFVRKMKRPVGSGVWSAYVLAHDAYGLWLHSPVGSLYRGEDGRTTERGRTGPGLDDL